SLLWLLIPGLLGLALALDGRAGDPKAGDPKHAADPKAVSADEQQLKAANIKTDGPALLEFLRARTLSEEDRERVELLINQLGASSFKIREQASQELIAKGAVVLELLRQAENCTDLEVQRRCRYCIQKIEEHDTPVEALAAVVRLIGVRRPA